MSEQCTCTYQHARCPIGIELEGKQIGAHFALLNATPENRVTLAQAFSEAVAAFQKHVEQKPLYQNHARGEKQG